jgi:hypothetical protein
MDSRIVVPNGNTPKAREDLAEICAGLAAARVSFEASWSGGSWIIVIAEAA